MRGKANAIPENLIEERITPAYAGKSPAGFLQYRDH